MYMHRNVTDKFIGTVASCDIISTGSWYGDLPDGIPKEVKFNRKDYYIEEIQHISIKETISVTYGIKWEHISKPVEDKIESFTTTEYSIEEPQKQYLLELMGRRFSDDIVLYDEDECAVQVQLINTDEIEFTYEFPFDNEMRAMSILFRQILSAPTLLLFDGNREKDRIQEIHIEVQKNMYQEYGDVNTLNFNWTHPSISIDCHSKQYGHTSHSHSEYIDAQMIHQLKQDIDFHLGDTLYNLNTFSLSESHDYDRDPARGGIVTVRIKWDHKEATLFIGNVTNQYVPAWYKNLISFIRAHTRDKSLQEFLQSNHISDRKIYTYCSVYIFKVNQAFYYRTDRNDIYEDDIVKVPFGADNTVRTGRVESISYHTRYDVPYDLNRTKFIIEKDVEIIYDTNLYRFDDMCDE
ncbi:MAG: hypothetical protein E6Z93_04000 [Veillonella sp.]|uniref:hypothetical protein n=1 Tax=Veillonella sp. TaxID=1926307 RepID=UPI0029096836|nr:hypothetical protein [Veillonella sp.]MDU5732567.1 hypothetical protein [Veillonella sp.]